MRMKATGLAWTSMAALACVALACSGGKNNDTRRTGQNGVDASFTFGDGGVLNPPVMTEIPIPPDCQNPGFPGGDQHFDFPSIRAQLVAMKPGVEQRQAVLLAARYDLADRPSTAVTMSRAKPVQTGVRVK